jgi:hypothetical protein
MFFIIFIKHSSLIIRFEINKFLSFYVGFVNYMTIFSDLKQTIKTIIQKKLNYYDFSSKYSLNYGHRIDF